MAVLLVEDDVAIRLTLVEHMEDQGLQVFDAADAEAALSILQAPPACISVLVTDLNLGPGDNGLILAAKARRQIPGLRIIYATGNPGMLHGRIVRPWERIFFKPFDAFHLVREVRALDHALLDLGSAAVEQDIAGDC
ncbi:response regulator [Dankookia sp. GCM10030260]|uniref:response regulator n=1 Tax=Dankookia sp. GCM10030260 TaxID=3273390 RepID=UPI00360FAFD5